MKTLFCLTLFCSALALTHSGCRTQRPVSEAGHDSHGHEHADAARQFTLFQDSLELFGEWAEWETGHENEMVIHLTDLRDYQAITEGTLKIAWQRQNQTVQQLEAAAPTRAGIYLVSMTPPAAGTYDLSFSLNSKKISGTIRLEKQTVYADHGAVPHHEESENPNEISFLKEQQWQIPFATERVARRTLYNTIRAVGEIKPVGEAEAEVYAPFDGVLLPGSDRGIVHPGDRVVKGESLGILTASGGTQGGWSDLVSRYKLSKAEYERDLELRKRGGISEQEFLEDSLLFQTETARLKSVIGSENLDERLLEDGRFYLRAPKSGVLSHVHLRFGQYVRTGERLLSIVDPAQVSLEANVAVGDAQQLRDIHGATFTVGGQDHVYSLAEFNGRLKTISALLDIESRRVPVIFELDNPKHELKPGSFARVTIQTSKAGDRLAVPEIAVLEEDGLPVAIVQTGGESYEKRILQTGIRDHGFVEVRQGLQEGERVVTTGAYKVKLAALKSGDLGHGHAH